MMKILLFLLLFVSLSIAQSTTPIFRGGTGANTKEGALKNLLPDSTGYADSVFYVKPGGGFGWKAAGGGGSDTSWIYFANNNNFTYGSGNWALSGSYNAALGDGALSSVTTAAGNVAIGFHALYRDSAGSNNVAIGMNALENNGTDENSVLGRNNVAVGYYSLNLNTGGDQNTAVGYSSLRNSTGPDDNAAFGASSLTNNTTGSENSAFGSGALRNLTIGSDNTAVGKNAGRAETEGRFNIFLGANSNNFNSTSLNNTFIAGGNVDQGGNDAIKDVYFGGGFRQQDSAQLGVGTDGISYAIHGSGCGMGSIDALGGSITLAGGISTGSGTGGDIIFKSSPAGSTGTSDNSLSELFRFKSSGDFQVAGSSGTSGQVLTSGGSGAAPFWADASGFDTSANYTITGTHTFYSETNGNLIKLANDNNINTHSPSLSFSSVSLEDTLQWQLNAVANNYPGSTLSFSLMDYDHSGGSTQYGSVQMKGNVHGWTALQLNGITNVNFLASASGNRWEYSILSNSYIAFSDTTGITATGQSRTFYLRPSNSMADAGIVYFTFPPTLGNADDILTTDGNGNASWIPIPAGGSVTSVALSLPNIFTVSGSPVTTTGTLSATLASQSQNLVFSSPNGSSGAPSFRSLTSNDIPSLTAFYEVPLTFSTGLSRSVNTITLNATTANVPASTDKNYVTDAQLTVIGNTSGTNTGDQTITLTGDVTGSGTSSFAATIGSNKVTTAKILDANVTLAKIANAAASSKLLGSGASGSGSPYTELTLGTGLSMSGTTLNATSGGTGTVTSVDVAIGGMTSSGAITTSGTITMTGALDINRGGTGNSSYTNGQLLIGNTSGNTLTKTTLTGTSNQVTVTNGSGSITLSTPQDIHTSATPQFARIGVNQSADATASFAGTQAVAANTIADGLYLQNSNAATSGNQMFSPGLHLKGFGFGTTAGTSQACEWQIFDIPVQSTVPINWLKFNSIVAGAAATTPFIFSSVGQLTIEQDGNALTPSYALGLLNATAATAGTTIQYSPPLQFQGTAYNSSSTLSETDKLLMELEPQTVAGTTTANTVFKVSINGGAFGEKFGFTSGGALRINGSTLGSGMPTMSSGILSNNTLAANSVLFASSTTAVNGVSSNLTYDITNGFKVQTTQGAVNSIINAATIENRYISGTAAAGLGTALLALGSSSTTVAQNMGRITWDWVDATHATRGSREKHWGVFNASSLTDIGTWALTAASTATLTVGLAGTTKGTLALTGNTSGTVTISPLAAAGTWTLSLPADGGTVGQFARTDGSGGMTWKNNASYQATPANPTGTTDATGKMMGLAGSITPNTSGQIIIIVSGDIANSNALGGCKVQLRYGTGSAPANGAALTGTTLGGNVTLTSAIGANDAFPFSVQGVVTGLTVATAYWIDVSVAATTAGTATPADISISAHEF